MAKSQGAPERSRAPARSRATRWRIGVLLLVHALFAVHLAHFVTTGRTVSPLEPSEAMEFAKRSAINAGLVFFVLTLGSTLLLGRFFCGWACHLVALQDLCRGLMLKFGITPRPLRSRWLAWVPMVAAIYMFVYPAVYRLAVHDASSTSQHLLTDDFWATFPGPGITLLTFLVCGFAAVFFLGSKGFCTYACPYGAFFGAVDRLAPGRIRVTDACEGCHHCTQVCTSNVDVGREVHDYGMVVDPGCMKCMDCVSVCPTDALYFGLGRPALGAKPRVEHAAKRRRLPWTEELLLVALFALVFFALRGLYGRIPFLLALGGGATVAFLLFRAAQLLTKPKLRLVHWELKRDGRLTRAGKRFAWAASLLLAGVLHSGALQLVGRQSMASFQGLTQARADWFVFPRRALTDLERAAAGAVRQHAGRALSLGLFGDPRRLEERGWARLLVGESEAGLADLRAARRAAPKRANLSVELGHLARSAGDGTTAFQEYRQALETAPDSLEIRQYVIDLAMELQQPQAALEALSSLQERRPWDATLLDQVGTMRVVTGDATGALRDLRQSLSLDDSRASVRKKLVQLLQLDAQKHLEADRLELAKKAAEEALSLLPGDDSVASWATKVLSAP